MDRVDSGEITEPELAAVLAHELAHIELGHGRAAAVRQTLSGWAGKALAARALGPLALFWLPAGMKSLSRGATRAAELQADAWAYSMLQRTRYDPEALDEVEIWRDGAFVERVRPLEVGPHRRPRVRDAEVELNADKPAPVADFLGHLVEKRRAQGFLEPTPRQLAEQVAQQRREADDAVVNTLADQLHTDVFDEAAVREYLARFGPFDVGVAATVVERLCLDSNDRHVSVYLDAIRAATGGDDE
jgi:predicted Zn-dependent protease